MYPVRRHPRIRASDRPRREGIVRRETRWYGAFLVAWSLFSMVPDRVAAQDFERPVRIWASAGLGGAYVRDIDVDGAVGLHLVGQWNEHSVTIRGLFLGDLGITDGSGRSARAWASARP